MGHLFGKTEFNILPSLNFYTKKLLKDYHLLRLDYLTLQK